MLATLRTKLAGFLGMEPDPLASFLTCLDSCPEGVLLIDRVGVIRWGNRMACGLFGLQTEEMPGKTLLGLTLSHEVQELLLRPDSGPSEFQLMLGQPVTVAAWIAPLGEHQLLFLADRTALKRLERSRTDFVANVSHELLTPITSIRAALESLEQGAVEVPGLRERFLGHIGRESERLEVLLQDLLSLASLEGSGERLDKRPVGLVGTLEAVLARLEPRIKEKLIDCRSFVPGGLAVLAHASLLSQVLFNLLDNAIKYGQTGGRLEIYAASRAGGVELQIADTGLGIPADDLLRIFERFYRVDKHRARGIGGTGLGLAIVKHIVEKHEGRVWAESILGSGSTFHVWLPD